mmetsp:Transcript_73876/g.207430  ORF Transcript_73876/g.207430 Transcript_73876/m.207430 type:complete len:83 (-) Transcript_73876:15-263(-)
MCAEHFATEASSACVEELPASAGAEELPAGALCCGREVVGAVAGFATRPAQRCGKTAAKKAASASRKLLHCLLVAIPASESA